MFKTSDCVFELHSGAGTCTPVRLSKLYPPKNLPRGITSADIWCYEYSFKDYRDDTNLHAVGANFGKVLVPFVAPEMAWTNGERATIARKHLRLSTQPGETFICDGYS